MALVGGPTAGIIGHIPDVTQPFPRMVGGERFSSIKAFERAISKGGTAVLPPGKMVEIKLPNNGLSGRLPGLNGLNQKSPFVVSYQDGYMRIAAKGNAKIGTTDQVELTEAGPMTAAASQSAKTFPFKLEVGVNVIRVG